MKADDIRLSTYDLRADVQDRSRRAVAAPRRGHGDHRDRRRAGGAARAGVDPRDRAQPGALSRSEGRDHRPVLRPQPARRPAGRAGKSRYDFVLRSTDAAIWVTNMRPRLKDASGKDVRARPRRAHRHRTLADAARHGAAGARPAPGSTPKPAACRSRSRRRKRTPRKSRSACRPGRRRRSSSARRRRTKPTSR